MKFAFSIIGSLFLWPLAAQNLVANPSFEQLTGCPDDYYQIYKAAPWFSPDCYPLRPDAHGFAVLLSGCNPTYVGVPKNNICVQEAHTGVGYVAIEAVSSYAIPNYRQYIETKLAEPMKAGKNYYFSMYFNFCDGAFYQPNPTCFNSDSTGVFFSETLIDKNPNCNPYPVSPQVHGTERGLRPGPQWRKIEGCYRSNGNENYLLIGNFGSETHSSCATQDTLPFFILLDDVSLIEEIQKTTDTTLCPAETWKMNAQDLRPDYTTTDGWTYQWDDGSTSPEHSFTKPGRQRLTVSKAGCFHDVYDYDVKFTPECACRIDMPNAFTPNGDGLNDVFYPHINCKAIEMKNFSMSIYNRWGEKVFYSTDKAAGWDGRYNGSIMSNQTFGWVIQYDVAKGLGAGHKQVSGTVMTLK